MAINNVVPYAALANHSSSADSASPVRSSSTRPRSPPAREESSLVISGLGPKMRRLMAQGVDEQALTIIASAQGQSQTRKDNLQERYVRWCLVHSCNPQTPASLVNFLAVAKTTRGLATSTLQAYRSTLLDLFEDRQAAASSAPLQTFLQAINSQTVRQEKDVKVDINPIIHHFRSFGSNSLVPIAQQTSKLCWLLGVCGLLRASDIERICLDASDWQSHQNKIVLVVVGPKEKRSGQRVRRTVHNEIVCRHGVPQYLLTDRGSNFTSGYVTDFLNAVQCKHLTTTAYRPQVNGLCERMNQTLVQTLSKICLQQEDTRNWDQCINQALLAIRTMPSDVTRHTPAKLLYGYEIRTPATWPAPRQDYVEGDVRDPLLV